LQNETQQQQIIKETFQLVSKRDDNVCNFLEGGSLIGGSDYKVRRRRQNVNVKIADIHS
jgi:hypothetical protein